MRTGGIGPCGVFDDKLMKQLLARRFSAQLAEKPFVETLNQLLLWVQTGFRYQTDGEQFGYEKPFFIEETLYYPACDCETVLFSSSPFGRSLAGKRGGFA